MGCELGLRFLTVKLLDLDEAMLEATSNPFATLILVHRDAQVTRGQPEERLRRKLMRYRALLRQGQRAADIRVLLRLMEHLLRLSPELAAAAYQAMRKVEQEETGMDTFVTSFEEIGEARGRVEGQRDMVLHLLERKLGPISDELRARIAGLSADALLNLSEALLDFSHVDNLTLWLRQQP